jgi:hypothetical protein
MGFPLRAVSRPVHRRLHLVTRGCELKEINLVNRHGVDITTSNFLTAGLLNDVGEFVGEKFLASPRPQTCRVTQEDIGADGKGSGLETIVEVGCFGPGVEPDMRQISTESCAHLGSHVTRQRLAAAATTLDPLFSVVVDRTARMPHNGIATDTPGWRPANIFRRHVTMLSDPPPNPANDLLGHCIGLTLSGIVCRPDGEL